MSNITLFIPDLFSNALASSYHDSQKLEALELFLGRAKVTQQNAISNYRFISELLNFQIGGEQDIPVAAVSRLLDAEERPDGYWLRADPVHLHADRDSLVLFDIPQGSLNQHDALALAAELRESIHAMGWELEVPIADRWYIKCTSPANILTTELDQVIGRDIQNYLPNGKDASNWHRLMTEIQMLLHSSEVNEVRQSKGELAVNSIWFWGAGELPEIVERNWSAVYSDDVFVKGLAMLSNTPCFALPDKAELLLSGEENTPEILVVMNVVSSSEAQQDYEVLERNWFLPLLEKMRAGEVKDLKIRTKRHCFELRKNDLNKFWRRPRSVKRYLPD